MSQAPVPALAQLKRVVGETLVRSRLDYTDHILILNAFLRDFRWNEGLPAERIKTQWERFVAAGLPQESLLSLYLHVPYCAKKCHFCYCSTEIVADPSIIDAYVPELEREIRYYAPVFAGVPVRLFQVGGGTPNILPASRLKELLASARAHFTIDPDGMRTIEFNPSGADREKLLVAREAGFNRVSFGVQSLNEQVLARENREYQSDEMIRDGVIVARELGFELINVDLLLGLAGESAESFLEGFRKIAELRPTTITVTGLSLTDAYLKLMDLDRAEKLRSYEAILPRAVEGIRRIGQACGYDVDSVSPERANMLVSLKDMPATVRERMVQGDHFAGGNLSVLGLGRQAWSHAFGQGIYERYACDFSESKPCYRLAPMSLKEEMMRHVLYALENHSRVDYVAFRRRFGEDFRTRFDAELRTLIACGKIELREDGVSFSPVRGPERIFYGMVFLLEALDPRLLRRLDQELPSLEALV